MSSLPSLSFHLLFFPFLHSSLFIHPRQHCYRSLSSTSFSQKLLYFPLSAPHHCVLLLMIFPNLISARRECGSGGTLFWTMKVTGLQVSPMGAVCRGFGTFCIPETSSEPPGWIFRALTRLFHHTHTHLCVAAAQRRMAGENRDKVPEEINKCEVTDCYFSFYHLPPPPSFSQSSPSPSSP